MDNSKHLHRGWEGSDGMIVIKKAAEIETIASFLVWGINGAGKTQFLASACDVPELQPSVIIDCEPTGSQTIRDNFPGCNVIEFETGRPLYKQFDEINKVLRDNKIKFVGIDGASFLLDSTLNDLPVEIWKRDGSEHLPYNMAYAIIKKWFTQVETICECVCTTCLSIPLKDTEGNVIGQKPHIPGNSFESILFSMFNTVAQMKVIRVKGVPVYTLTTKSGSVSLSRTKARAIYDIDMVNPTMGKFYALLTGKEVLPEQTSVQHGQPGLTQFNKK